MEVGGEHDDGEGQDEDGVRVVEPADEVRVAVAVPLGESLQGDG